MNGLLKGVISSGKVPSINVYRVTKVFIGGTLSGLTHTADTYADAGHAPKVGTVVKRPVAGSPYRIARVEDVTSQYKTVPITEHRHSIEVHSQPEALDFQEFDVADLLVEGYPVGDAEAPDEDLMESNGFAPKLYA